MQQRQLTTDDWVDILAEDSKQIEYLNDPLLNDLIGVLQSRRRPADTTAVMNLVGAVAAAAVTTFRNAGRTTHPDVVNARCWLGQVLDEDMVDRVVADMQQNGVAGMRGRTRPNCCRLRTNHAKVTLESGVSP
jgi:hypothetical protein